MRIVKHDKRSNRMRRHKRVREKVFGTAERPRLVVFRSLNHIYAQVVDDEAGRTIVSASSLKIVLPPADEEGRRRPESVKMRRSRSVGAAIAEAALAKGISQVAFDRDGYLFHGRVAALAEAARKAGLKF